MQNSKRKSVEQTARMNVISSILAGCSTFVDGCGSQPVAEAISSLDRLSEMTPAQVKQTIGLVDGNLELNHRYAQLAKSERQQVAEEAGFDDADDVCTAKARAFNGGQFDRCLKEIKVRLQAIVDLLTAPAGEPSPKDMISVPDGPTQPSRRDNFGSRAESPTGR